jgi:hypothetical protein
MAPPYPSGHFTVSNSCGQITYQQHTTRRRLDRTAPAADSLAMTTPDREPVYDVVWPLAPAAAPEATLADRVGDLSGKTVGELWDYLFKGEQMFPLIRKALEQRDPGIRFVPYDTLGSTHGRDEAELAATLPDILRKHGCDAVISAVGA